MLAPANYLSLTEHKHTHSYHAFLGSHFFHDEWLRLWGWQLAGTSNLARSVPAEAVTTATGTFSATAYGYDTLRPTASFKAADMLASTSKMSQTSI
jgi:hypothetical protein